MDIYVAKNIDNEGALIPYIVVGRYDNFSNETQFLNSFTELYLITNLMIYL